MLHSGTCSCANATLGAVGRLQVALGYGRSACSCATGCADASCGYL